MSQQSVHVRPAHVRRKYRPSVRAVLLLLNLAVLALPLAGFMFMRIYENQLVRETESELIAQSAIVAAMIKRAVEKDMPDASQYGRAVEHAPGAGRDERFTPVFPIIDLARDELLPPRPEGEAADVPPNNIMQAIGQDVATTFHAAQMVTLAGLRILDHNGVVIGGRGDAGLSFAALPEIQMAMTGRYAGVIRRRESDTLQPAITSISRSAQVRVFAAYPVVASGRLHGIAYMSRTPENIWRRLYHARERLLLAGLVLVAIAAALAIVASRTIFGPVDALIRQSDQLAAGRIDALQPLRHAGTREIARLADSFADMALALQRRSSFIRQFAAHVGHEFKTPLTSIKGAAELLGEHQATMSEDQRAAFVRNINDDADRLRRLVERLNQLARAKSATHLDAPVDVSEVLEQIALRESDASLALSVDGLRGCLVHLAEEGLEAIVANLKSNAVQAGSSQLKISVSCDNDIVRIVFADNGTGIAAENRDRIFEPFFTTRREQGGSGLGLRIIRSLIEPHGGNMSLADSDCGTTFIVALPRAAADGGVWARP